MNSVFSIAVSALKAYDMKLRAGATNIAHMNTENYRPLEVSIEEVSSGGVKAQVFSPDNAYRVDIAKELVDLIGTEHSFRANIETIKTEDEIMRDIIDIKA